MSRALCALGFLTLLIDPGTTMAQGREGFSGFCATGSTEICVARVASVNVNLGDISFTLDLPQTETDKLSCSGGGIVNFRLTPGDEGNENYQRMFDHLSRAADNGRPIELLVGGSLFDCQPRNIRVEYDLGGGGPPGRP